MPDWAYYVQHVVCKGGEISVLYVTQGGPENGTLGEITIEEFAERVRP